jgi:hypothetical protein
MNNPTITATHSRPETLCPALQVPGTAANEKRISQYSTWQDMRAAASVLTHSRQELMLQLPHGQQHKQRTAVVAYNLGRTEFSNSWPGTSRGTLGCWHAPSHCSNICDTLHRVHSCTTTSLIGTSCCPCVQARVSKAALAASKASAAMASTQDRPAKIII